MRDQVPEADADGLRWTRRETLPLLAGILGAGLAAGRAADGEERTPAGADSGARVYSMRAYGAKGDGTTLDTAGLQQAIDACAADGGGVVLVPAGTFLIGTVEVKSNVTLRIAAGGKLLGSTRGSDYHAVDAIPLTGDSTLEDGNWALLYAVNAHNVTIEGPGAIDGQGIAFHSPERGTPPPSGLGGRRRPYHLLFYRCRNLRVCGIDLLNSAYHSVRVIESERVHMNGIYIYNRVNGNNDGFHFISCQYVMVSGCTVLSQDDACALFGSCRFVTVTNSSFSTRWSCFRFGGGIAQDVAVSNCVLHQVFGCPIKFQGVRGSRFENMSFSNLVLDEVTGPISISIGPREYHENGPSPAAAVPAENNEPPVVRNLSFSNIHGTVTTNPPQLPGFPYHSGYRPGELHSCIVLDAVGDAILEKVTFENVHLTFGGGGTADDAARRDLPEIAGEYFVLGPMPAYGLYARNARALTLNNVRFEVETPDLRPALILDRVHDAAMTGVAVQGNAEAESVLRFIDTQQVLIAAPRVLQEARVFLRVEGAGNSGIIVDGGDLTRADQPVALAGGAQPGAVHLRS
ncbi:MAG TPA: glycosyl hydrolase family 28 protein [Acidobacteriaceae bacterium]|nr:glycosyl hydrolase family 28 protein [Acidobacteriaceae bacterium]